MTLEEIESMKEESLTCKQVANVLGLHERTIHDQAVNKPSMLGFNVVVANSRVSIPRRAFLRFMKGENITGPRFAEHEPAEN